MTRTTQRELKQGVQSGIYTQYAGQEVKSITKIRYSTGYYGINGGLFRDNDTGILYAITARNSDLFKIF